VVLMVWTIRDDLRLTIRMGLTHGLRLVHAVATWHGASVAHPCAKPLFQRGRSGGAIRCRPRRRAGFCFGGERLRMGSVSTTSAVSIASVMSIHAAAARDSGAPSGAMKP